MRILIIALALCACGKKANDKPEAKDKASDKPVETKPVNKPPSEAFADGKVGFPAPIAKLVLNMPEADATAAAPDIKNEKMVELPGYEGLSVFTRMHAGRLSQVFVEIDEPCDKAKEWLTKKWGAPLELTTSSGKKLTTYASPDVTLRAVLEERVRDCQLNYQRVWTKEQLLGSDPKLFGFEKAPLIGITQDELMKTYADLAPTPRADDPGAITLDLPALTTSEYDGHATVRVKDGKVTGYTVSIVSGGDKATDDAIVPRLEQMFGKAKKDGTGLYLDFKGPPPAKAEIREKDSASFGHMIWVGDYKK